MKGYIGEKTGAHGKYVSEIILKDNSEKRTRAITSFFKQLPEKEVKLRKELRLLIWMIEADVPLNTLEVI